MASVLSHVRSSSRALITRLSSRSSVHTIDKIIKDLKGLERMAPAVAQSHQTVEEARSFLRKIKECDPNKLQTLKIELLAFRLGIESDKLTDKSFTTFAEKIRLYNYLTSYNHRLGYANGEILLGSENNQKPWSEVKQLTQEKLPNQGEEFVQPWYYGEKGIQKVKDMYGWDQLTPYKRVDPSKHGGGYAYGICSTAIKCPRLQGDHTFIRLYTPSGEVYSIGLYRPEKRIRLEKWWLPLRVKQARLMSPDVSDFWGVDIQELTVAISKEQFDQIKLKAEADSKAKLRFHPLNDNCTRWAMQTTGFHLSCRDMAPRAMVNYKIVQFSDRHFNKLPNLVQKICSFAVVLFFNLVSFFGGSFWVDGKMKGETPHLQTLTDIISAEKLLVESPHKLGTVVIPQVKKWRAEKMAELKANGASNEEIHKVEWGLPPEGWVCSS